MSTTASHQDAIHTLRSHLSENLDASNSLTIRLLMSANKNEEDPLTASILQNALKNSINALCIVYDSKIKCMQEELDHGKKTAPQPHEAKKEETTEKPEQRLAALESASTKSKDAASSGKDEFKEHFESRVATLEAAKKEETEKLEQRLAALEAASTKHEAAPGEKDDFKEHIEHRVAALEAAASTIKHTADSQKLERKPAGEHTSAGERTVTSDNPHEKTKHLSQDDGESNSSTDEHEHKTRMPQVDGQDSAKPDVEKPAAAAGAMSRKKKTSSKSCA